MKLLFARVPTKEQIKAALEQHLPQFQYSFRVGKLVDCKQTFFVGATVVPKKDGVLINSNFPSAGAAMLFTLFMFATGILVGLLVWLLVWKSSQDKVRDQIAAVLGGVFGATNQPKLQGGQQPQLQGAPGGQMQPGMPPHGQPMPAHGQPQMQPAHGQPMQHQPHQHHQMQPPQHQQHQQHQMQPPQHMLPQGFSPGMQVFVAPGDGQRYPATVVSAANGQYQCMMPNGHPYWFPAQNVSVS